LVFLPQKEKDSITLKRGINLLMLFGIQKRVKLCKIPLIKLTLNSKKNGKEYLETLMLLLLFLVKLQKKL